MRWKKKKKDECYPAKNVKKAKKAEVNYCPSHPTGETDDSLENLRVELLSEVRQRNGASNVREKMSKTFSYRRKEVVHESPGAGEFKVRWPALFHINEVNASHQSFHCAFSRCVMISLCMYKNGISLNELAVVDQSMADKFI